jgi:CubicO group peptidase (beta-lactamase class C family)
VKPPTTFLNLALCAVSAVIRFSEMIERRITRGVLLLALALPLAAQHQWPTVTPHDAGFDPARLEALKQDLAAHRTTALIIVRRGKIVSEWYAPGNGPEKRQGTASLAKAIVGGMSLLLAIDEGRIRADDLASKYIPSWKDDSRKSRITLRHLATHTSGIEDAEQDGLPHDKLPGWKGAFWRRDPDPFSIAIRQAPAVFEPGTSYAYSNPGMAALSYAVTAGLKGAPQSDVKALLDRRVMSPLGIPPAEWSIGYGRGYEVDGLTLYANWGGGAFTPRAVAKLGLLMLQRGEWDRRQLIARESVEQSLAYAGSPVNAEANAPASGLGWWLNTNGGWEGIPRDAFGGAGAGHQVLMVVPSLDLVVVRNGQALDATGRGAGFWTPLVTHVLRPVVEAIAEKTAYPPSHAIQSIRFDAPSAIVCKANDSDNWPITWADDGHQYTSYGDGWGFDPRIDKKLSQGFARIEGPSRAFRGVNIRSATGERTGDGAKGLKASGMLMVDGVLYMWVRNAGNAQLAWSNDRGKTWQWGFRFENGFGSPSFLNFGRNYSGARDQYVYTYSQNGASAYQSDDSLLLARVRKQQISDRGAWEFFERLDDQGRPVWTSEVERRGEVFRYPRHCQRVDAVYHPGLKRYLVALGYDHEGGWGIYDAPEPWGPWTTAFHTENWGLGGTHGYRLPAKWIERNGRMALIFSGVKPYDAFCVRPMTLEQR